MDIFAVFFSLVGILFIYMFSFHAIVYKNYSLFAIVYMIFIYFYDFFFINAYYILPNIVLNLVKPYNEYLVVLLLVKIYISNSQKKINKNSFIDKTMLILIFPSVLVLVLNDFLVNINLSDTIAGIRIYILPILLPYLMFKANWLNKVNKKHFLSVLFIMTIITIIYGTIQKLNFNGDVRSLWFYEFFNQYDENPVELGPFNFIRNNVLRTTSFFVSPIIYSIAIAISTIFVIELLISKNKFFPKWILLILLIIYVYGLIIAETRVGLFITIMGAGMIFMNKKYKLMSLLPILAIVVTIFSLVNGYTDDVSALARIVQYSSFFDYFNFFGLGFNSEYVLTYFDTFYMSLGLVYGVFVFFPVYFYFRLNKILYKILFHLKNNDFNFGRTVFIISLTFIYSFAFQFTAGAYQYRMIFFLIFMVLANYPTNAIKNTK